MRILLAGLASPGFIMPLVACARELRERGHEVAFVTDISMRETLERAGFPRVSRGTADGPSFTVQNWYDVDAASLQALHIEYALRIFRPDAMLASMNSLGAAVIAARRGLPLTVLGSAVFLWPTAAELGAPVATPQDARRRGRLGSMIGYLNEVRARFGMHALAPGDTGAIAGDRHIVQGVAALQPTRLLDEACRFAGGGLLRRAPGPLPRGDAEWLEEQRAGGRRVVYAQFGRAFDHKSYADVLFAWAAERDVALLVDASRHERSLATERGAVRRHDGIDFNDVLPHVDGVICGGHPAAVIGAIAYRLPLAICFSGSGTDDIGEACAHFGLAAAVDAEAATPAEFRATFDRLVGDPRLGIRSCAAADAFERLDGAALVADAVTGLAAAAPCPA